MIHIHVEARQGKHTGPREVTAFQNHRDRVFELKKEISALRALHDSEPPVEAFAFALPRGEVPVLSHLFRELLNELGIRFERTSDKERSLYSLRHYYGTEQAHRGVACFKLAKQMGTSLAMLERYYIYSDIERNADEMSGTTTRHSHGLKFAIR